MNDPRQRFRFRRTEKELHVHIYILSYKERTTVIGDIRQIIGDNVSLNDNAVGLSCVDIGSHTKGTTVHSKRGADATLKQDSVTQ